MIILLYDFETTGLDPVVHSICEYGACLWDTTQNRIIRLAGSIINDPNATWNLNPINANGDTIVDIHGITPELCQQVGMLTEKAFRQFMSWANSADVFCAWNGKAFDFNFWEAWATKNASAVPERLRLDPMIDIIWPQRWSRELFYVAAKHGILNHFQHSGVGDVLTMVEILSRHSTGGHKCPVCGVVCDLGAILEYAKMPEIWIEGVCSIDDRERVKTNGYHWWPWPQNQDRDKKWIKKIKEGLLDQEIARGKEIGYGVRRLA